MTITPSCASPLPTEVPAKLVASIRAQATAIAADVVHAVHGPSKGAYPAVRTTVQETVQAAYCAIDRVLRIAECRPTSHPWRAEATTDTPETLTVSKLATAQTWQLLLRGANAHEREHLLARTDVIFGQEGTDPQASARPLAESADLLRLTEALIRHGGVRELEDEIRVLLATVYLVMIFAADFEVLDTQARLNQELGHRSEVLVGRKSDRPVLLLPLNATVPAPRLREVVERTVHGLPGNISTTVAVAQADEPGQVAHAVEEALSVLQVIDLLGHPKGVYQLDDVPIEVSLLRSPDLANLLAMRLAPLRGSGAPLLETLQTYLDTVQDRRRTARILNIHPNTLDYRLRRVKELTGLSPAVPRDIQTLGAAFAAWKLVGMPGPATPP